MIFKTLAANLESDAVFFNRETRKLVPLTQHIHKHLQSPQAVFALVAVKAVLALVRSKLIFLIPDGKYYYNDDSSGYNYSDGCGNVIIIVMIVMIVM